MLFYAFLGVAAKSSGGTAFQIVYIALLFAVIILGAYYTSKFVGKYGVKRTNHANLKIVEAIAVGPQKSLQLVKVGKEFVLIGVTKDRITFVKEISGDQIDLILPQSDSFVVVPFRQYFDKLIHKKKPNMDEKK